MADETWRPLGVDTEDDIAEYDALHEGVPDWMAVGYWDWVKRQLSSQVYFGDRSGRYIIPNTALIEQMGQVLQLSLSPVRLSKYEMSRAKEGEDKVRKVVAELRLQDDELKIADYLLAFGPNSGHDALDALLQRSKSAYTVGKRLGKPGLVRRVPIGVQEAADSVMGRAGLAGVRLSKAWEELYGLNLNASEAYRQAILAVEDAAVPVVSPNHGAATLGTVLSQIENQKDWQLPMHREHAKAPSSDVVMGMMRLLWHGQHDRHGGQPSAPGNVSVDEATVAVSLAVTLVNLFDAGLVQRQASQP